ncbi:MAG: hypothetical protein JNL19_03565 [Burkholderiales bacterium]|nr:hypothetical protein [Burkholderiales bacterium]
MFSAVETSPPFASVGAYALGCARALLIAFAAVLATIFAASSLAIPGQPGTLDATWATTSPLGAGKLISPIGTGHDYAFALALQPDGKVLVAGYCDNGGNADFCLARYSAGGALDTSFNGTGKVITAIGLGSDIARALAIQPDGKIVVAGYCLGAATTDFCLARYTASGALDTSFNGTGKVITAIGLGSDVIRALAIQPDGKIVAAGYCDNGANAEFCLARYTAGGALDTSFNGTGTVVTAVGTGNDYAFALALQHDGKILLAGYCSNGTNSDVCLARYSIGGTLDLSFNSTGKVITPVGSGEDRAYAIAVQPDGKIVVAGYSDNGGNAEVAVVRYSANGALDTSFGGTGKVLTAIGTGTDIASALALQPDGKVVVAGICLGAFYDDFCLARYGANGTLDASFNSSGKVITPIGSTQDRAYALALQPDGKIVVAGYCDNAGSFDFCVARYDGGPFDAQNCKLDLDGDGVVLATTDMLIGARVALGLTGNAVIGGITFAPHASRQTWADIRTYLVTQCGLSIAP